MSGAKPVTRATYDELSSLLNGTTSSEVGFVEELCASPYRPPATRFDPVATHAAIRSFQRVLVGLWLGREWPETHRAPVWGAPVPDGALDGNDPEILIPCFVRTDESVSGKIYELQCPGGWWGIAQALGEVLRPGRRPTLADAVAEEITSLFPEGARVLHLFDTAGMPHDSQFFAHRLRATGANIQYRGIDPGVFPSDCNFVRAHSYGGVVAEDLFRLRLTSLRERTTRFDHPPLPVFDQKLPLALPFDPATSHHFTDAHRSLFPYTALVRDGAVVLASGDEVALADIVRSAPEDRQYYLKYAGMDTTRNYGARAVHRLTDADADVLRAIPRIVERDGDEPWILQEDSRTTAVVERVRRDGGLAVEEMTVRLSRFYGPRRPLGALFLAQSAPTVRGGATTVLAIVDEPDSPATDKGG